MNELLKAKRLNEVSGNRKTAGYLALAAGVLELIAVLFLPLFGVEVLGVKQSYTVFDIARLSSEVSVWAFLIFMVLLAVAQLLFAALTFFVGSTAAGVVDLLLEVGVYQSACAQDDYGVFTMFAKRGAGQYVLLLAVVLHIVAIVLTLTGNKTAQPAGGSYAAPAQPYQPQMQAHPAAPAQPAAPAAPGAPRGRGNIVPPAGVPVQQPVQQPAQSTQPAQQVWAPNTDEETHYMGVTYATLTRAATGEQFPITSINGGTVKGKGAIVIGRKPEQCSIVLPNRLVSGVHARIYWQNEQFCLEDLGSTNGTTVNGHPIAAHSPVILPDGATIVFADEQVTFRLNP